MPHYPTQSTLPHYHEDVFSDLAIAPRGGTSIQWTPQNFQGVGAASAADVAASPMLAAIKVLRAGVNGLGQDPNAPPKPTAGQYALVAAFLALGGFLSYQAGKAMTPAGSSSTTWAWIAVPTGLFTGVIGLGIMGAVSNSKEK